MQILPRYPCFYTLLTKKQTPIFIHFFEKTLKHTFLFSKFLDPILIDSYFLVKKTNFNIIRPFSELILHPNNELQELAQDSHQLYTKMTKILDSLYETFPMTLVLRIEMLRLYMKTFFKAADQLLFLLDELDGISREYCRKPKLVKGSLELEVEVYEILNHLRNTSLSLFMTTKLINWYEFLDRHGFISLFVNCFEFLSIKMSEKNFFKKDLILKFLNFPVYARRTEVNIFEENNI